VGGLVSGSMEFSSALPCSGVVFAFLVLFEPMDCILGFPLWWRRCIWCNNSRGVVVVTVMVVMVMKVVMKVKIASSFVRVGSEKEAAVLQIAW
jgi:hypothetical protein